MEQNILARSDATISLAPPHRRRHIRRTRAVRRQHPQRGEIAKQVSGARRRGDQGAGALIVRHVAAGGGGDVERDQMSLEGGARGRGRRQGEGTGGQSVAPGV